MEIIAILEKVCFLSFEKLSAGWCHRLDLIYWVLIDIYDYTVSIFRFIGVLACAYNKFEHYIMYIMEIIAIFVKKWFCVKSLVDLHIKWKYVL